MSSDVRNWPEHAVIRLMTDIENAPWIDESEVEHHFRTSGEQELSVTLRSDHRELD